MRDGNTKYTKGYVWQYFKDADKSGVTCYIWREYKFKIIWNYLERNGWIFTLNKIFVIRKSYVTKSIFHILKIVNCQWKCALWVINLRNCVSWIALEKIVLGYIHSVDRNERRRDRKGEHPLIALSCMSDWRKLYLNGYSLIYALGRWDWTAVDAFIVVLYLTIWGTSISTKIIVIIAESSWRIYNVPIATDINANTCETNLHFIFADTSSRRIGLRLRLKIEVDITV